MLVSEALSGRQTPEALAKVHHVLRQLPHWQLAAVELAADTAKSMTIAVALLQGHINAEAAAAAVAFGGGACVQGVACVQRWAAFAIHRHVWRWPFRPTASE